MSDARESPGVRRTPGARRAGRPSRRGRGHAHRGDGGGRRRLRIGQIVKTLVAYVAGAPMLVLVAGDRRLDDRALAARFGVGRKQVKLANAEQVLALTGYPVGGVSPFGLPQPLDVLVDEGLGRFEAVWIAGGTPSAILPIALAALVRHTGGVIAAVAT